MQSYGSDVDKCVDHFIICGLNEKDGLDSLQSGSDEYSLTPFQVSYKPSILWHYPGGEFEADGIKLLCMPRGVSFRKFVDIKDHKKFHSFLQTKEDGEKLYGFVYTFFEEIKNQQLLSAMDVLFKMFDTEVRSRSPKHNVLEKRKQRGIRRGKSVYSYNKDIEPLFASKCICIIMKQPYLTVARKILEDILAVGLNEVNHDLPVESYIFNLLFEIPCPPPGRTMKFLSLHKDSFIISRPPSTELPYFDYSFKEVLMTLGYENLVDLFTCMLLEHQILFLSSDMHKLMLIAESLTILFFPLRWQHVYVPVLPPSLLHFLDAPVPFIMGLYYENEEEKNRFEIPIEGTLCLLDIDNNEIQLPQEIPDLPGRKELIEELERFGTMYGIITPRGLVRLRPDNSFQKDIINLTPNSFNNYLSEESSQKDVELVTKNLGRLNYHNELGKCQPIPEDSPLQNNIEPLNKEDTADPLGEEHGTEISNFNQCDLFVQSKQATTLSRKQQHENEINIIVREIFVNRFTQMLVDYEQFVILPRQTKDDWLSNREHMQNFDKASFLSDQSRGNLPFMTLFVETQGFTSLIDMKIMALWDDCDPRLTYFDKRVDKMKVKLGIIRSSTYEECTTVLSSVDTYVMRCSVVDHIAPQPRAFKTPIERAKQKGFFPQPFTEVFDEKNRKRSGRINWRKRERAQQLNEQEGQKMKEKLAQKVKKYIQDSRMITKGTSQITPDENKTIFAFSDKLLKECKVKTKRLVLLKLGQEAVELGHGCQNTLDIEENTLIASLCDLLERVWSHGVLLRQLDLDKDKGKSKFVQRMRQSKSALWAHLSVYYERQCDRLAAVYGLTDLENVVDEIQKILMKDKGVQNLQSNRKQTIDSIAENIHKVIGIQNIEINEDTQSYDLEAQNSIPTSESRKMQELTNRLEFLSDLKTILGMKEIKTDTGYSRAWTRLALEKKVLAKQLRILLSDKKLMFDRYKDYAFIRTDEEMEQFLFHLLSLNAVDFNCFTYGFVGTNITYKIHVVNGKQMSAATTANCWINMAGSNGTTGTVHFPKGDQCFRFQHKNLGILTAIRIGHDNTGISPSWFIDHVSVTNEVTGHAYRFICGRWLSRSQDDGSTERLLVADVLSPEQPVKTKRSNTLPLPTPPERLNTAVTGSSRKIKLFQKVTTNDVQEHVADSVNKIVKYFYTDSQDNFTKLLIGSNGFCEAVHSVFTFGFKTNRLFSKKIFVWDYIEKVSQEWVTAGTHSKSEDLITQSSFCTTVQTINTASLSIGKDQKLELFICLGLRNKELSNWLKLLHRSNTTFEYYENGSFLHDEKLLSYIIEALEALNDYDITLDKSITRGI